MTFHHLPTAAMRRCVLRLIRAVLGEDGERPQVVAPTAAAPLVLGAAALWVVLLYLSLGLGLSLSGSGGIGRRRRRRLGLSLDSGDRGSHLGVGECAQVLQIRPL